MSRIDLIRMRRGFAADWVTANPVLDSAEFGVELDTGKFKIGNASAAWLALEYATDISDLPTSVITLNQSDAFGRVQVISEPIPSIMDWGALGDGATDDTTAVTAAITALSTVGVAKTAMVPLRFPEGRCFVLDRVIPSSWVDIQAHGALLKRTGSHNTGLFAINPTLSIGSPIDHFALRGATLIGTQTEQTAQSLVNIQQSTNIWIQDCTVDNVNAPGISIADCQWVRVTGNKLTRMGSAGNTITFIDGSAGNTIPLKYIWCLNNYVDHIASANGESISIVATNTANRTDPVCDAHICDNTVLSEAASSPIYIERGGNVSPPPNISGIDISGNTLFNNTAGASTITCGLTASVTGNDPMAISGVTITRNRIFGSGSTGHGIQFDGSRSLIADNYIEAGAHDITLIGHGTGVNHHLTVKNNQGGLGTGDAIHIVTTGLFDYTTCNFDLDFNNGKLRQITSGTAAPVAGTWAKGAVCWNTTPGAATTLLWVCTTAGTPGTWTASTLP